MPMPQLKLNYEMFNLHTSKIAFFIRRFTIHVSKIEKLNTPGTDLQNYTIFPFENVVGNHSFLFVIHNIHLT